jgi:hypothetical protein
MQLKWTESLPSGFAPHLPSLGVVEEDEADGRRKLPQDMNARRNVWGMKPLFTLSCEHFNFPEIGNILVKVKALLCRKYENRGEFKVGGEIWRVLNQNPAEASYSPTRIESQY